MKTIETLLKVTTKKVEESQKDIAKLLKVMQKMDGREKELNLKIETENTAASHSDDVNLLSFAGKFTLKSTEEIEDIQQARKDAKALMVEKRSTLRGHFAEQKRYEILLDRKRKALKKERDKKQQKELDDLSTMRHRQGH